MSEGWLQLTSGGGYDFDTRAIFGPFTPRRDIAHPLSLLARFVGHTSVPWSVASHSICVALTIRDVKFGDNGVGAGLMHDAHEAVIGDIPTPLGRALGPVMKIIKCEIQNAIHEELEITPSRWPSSFADWIHSADSAALLVEKQMLMLPEPRDWGVTSPGQEWLLAYHDNFCKLVADRQTFGQGAEDAFMWVYDEYVENR